MDDDMVITDMGSRLKSIFVGVTCGRVARTIRSKGHCSITLSLPVMPKSDLEGRI